MIDQWQNKSIAILGYGVEGTSSVGYFLRHKARVTVYDQKELHLLGEQAIKDQANGVRFISGQNSYSNLDKFDLIMRSPSFPINHPALKTIPGEKVSSQTKLFLTKWRDQSAGVSGTKGKGTVASLLHHLLASSGKKTVLGGNIGVPLLDIIDEMTADHIAVLELSSFQLWDVSVSPRLAILTMITPEHLDVHQSLDNYLTAKQNLLRYQSKADQAIILSDSNLTKHIANLMPARQWRVSEGWVEQGARINGTSVSVQAEETFNFSSTSANLIGNHNAANAALAVVAASLLGLHESDIKKSLSTYQPLPHRLELVSRLRNLVFFDDSIATTPIAALAALKSFTEPLVVLLGGINKQADWSEIATYISKAENIKACVVMGDEAKRIQQAIIETGSTLPILVSPPSLDKAVSWSAEQLQGFEQGIVLLSPGAKSFDQYQDYQQRGRQFQQAVRQYISKT